MSDGLQLEIETLAELTRLCRSSSDDERRFRPIADRLAAVSALTRTAPLAAERELEQIAVRLRRTLLARAHEHADPHFRSPVHGPAKALPSGDTISYIYERSANPTGLERRVATAAPAPRGWRADHVAFSSGMAAISAVLQCYRSMVRATEQDPLRVGVWGGYFETDMVLELLRSGSFTWEAIPDLLSAVGRGGFDMLFVEPVRYTWDLTALDLGAFARAWRGRSHRRTRALVFDTTLASFTWPGGRVLEALRDGSPLLVIEVRSGLKLDQQGLELANLGIVSIYSCHEDEGTPTAEQFGQYLRMIRSITGTALSMDAIAALDAPFLADPVWLARHAGQVFINNRDLAGALAHETGLFSKIAHPSLTVVEGPLRHAPFVVCQLAEDTIDNHGFLLAVVREEARRQGICLDWGSSFGFRSHRWETIIPRVRDRRGLFKIAMGARTGPSFHAAIELFRRLARYPDFATLRRDYPGLAPLDLMAMAQPEPSASGVDRPPVGDDETGLLVQAQSPGGVA
ncbi:hypothetical protein [Thermoactinospora rubra]|uniref:hypothetical protein n=1 Tax=Thermoactinospora rubra TaxID=1088767 RepID=UPI000A1184D8|nr:hypothetical protein [Thermoactinospora rubra]